MQRLAVVQGMADTRAALRAWNAAPWPVLGRWAAVSLGAAALLLLGTWLVALAVTPDPTPRIIPGLHTAPDGGDVVRLFSHNLLVLALHAMACLAGFIAGSSLPREAESYRGWVRTVHDHAGRVAMAFVAGATVFSLVTQALVLGWVASTLAAQFGTSPGVLVLSVLPHALPELVAVFLPLGAWLATARAGRWDQLMAASVASSAIALPLLLVAGLVEVYVTPHLMRALHFV